MRPLSTALLLIVASLGRAPLCAQTMEEAAAQLEAGRVDEAVATLRRLAEQAAGGDPELAARAWSDACVLESDRGRYREALADCEHALDARTELPQDAGQARILNNLGRALLGLGRWDEAGRRFREALELNRTLGEGEGEVINLLNLGVTADRQARFGEALYRYDAAAARIEEHSDDPWADGQRTFALLNRAALLERIGAHDEALPLYFDLLAAAGTDVAFEAALEANLAVVYRNLGDAEEAERRLEHAVSLYQTTGDRAGLANAILNLGLLRHHNLRRPADAELDLRRALDLARQAGDRSEEIQALYYLGGSLLDQERWNEAEATFTECADLASDSGSAEGRWSAAEGLGRVEEVRGDLAAALGHYTSAMTILEGVRAELAVSPRRAGFFGAQRPVYAAAVRTIVALAERQPAADWNRRAVEVVQRAKARDLVEALRTPVSTFPAAPRNGRERAATTQLPTLEIFLGAGSWYSWWIDATGPSLVGTGDAAPLLERVERVHRSLAHGTAPLDVDLGWLSTHLLGTAEPPPAFAVAPDGRLWYLPFDLLPVRDAEGRSALLLERSSLHYLPSGAAQPPVSSPHGAETVFLGFAPLSAGPEIPARLAGRELPSLPSSERELESAARLLGGKAVLYRGPEATEEAFRRATASPGARVLHLASHTVVNEGRRDGVGVVLAPGGDDDGLLVPTEISATTVNVDLTVLAACTTVLGFEDDGLGLATLAGAFLAAGSKAVLVTLWEVDDTTSRAFFEQYYYQLARGAAPAKALQLTKTALRADSRWSNPSLWAGFTLVGNTAPVRDTTAKRRWMLIGGAPFAIVVLALAWLAIRRLQRGQAESAL